MALQSRTITVGADKDSNNGGKNYVSGQVIYIKDELGVLAPIFKDIDGLDPIPQNTISNVTNAKGQFTFFVEEGNYTAEYNDQSTPLFVFGADYFNNQIDFVTKQILSNTQPYSAGNFTDGFTFTELNQYGNATVNDGGTDYATTFWYIGGTLPHAVAPLTNPRDFPLLYQQRDFNSAEFVATKTTESAQDFIDSFALKVFQSPAGGALTEIQTRTVETGDAYEVRKTSDDSLATIYSDSAGAAEIIQNGTDNVSSVDGVVDFYIADGDYYIEVAGIKGNFKVSSGSTSTKTEFKREWYVNPSTGIDSPLMGTSDLTPFKTIQYAFDQLPDIISHQQTINISSGLCNESSRDSSDMPRPAIFYPQGKYIARRTSQSGSDLSGSVVIKGAGVGSTIIETDPPNGYVNGVYVSGTEIAIQDLTVRPKSGESTSTCITTHRGAYVHGRNLAVGGTGSSLGLVCESGAWAEMVSCAITGSDNKDVVVFPTSGCSLAGDNSDIGDVQSSGFIQFAQQLTVNGDVSVTSSGNCQITSNVLSNAVVFNGAVTVSNAPLSAAFATFNESITATLSTIKLSACSYQKSITLFGGGLDLDASNSFVSPNTNNDTLAPVVLRDGARIDKDSASIIRNSAGDEVGADFGNLSITVSSDGFAIPISITGRHIDIEIIGSGANRLGAELPLTSDLGSYPDGTTLRVVGAGFNVEIIESTAANIPNGSITVGGLSGGYSGATFVYSSRSSKWNLQAVGLVNP